jgi:hypothetical protein
MSSWGSGQVERGLAFERETELVFQDGVVDGREILGDVALQDVPVAAAFAHGELDRLVSAEACSRSEAAGREAALEDGLDDLGQGMVLRCFGSWMRKVR